MEVLRQNLYPWVDLQPWPTYHLFTNNCWQVRTFSNYGCPFHSTKYGGFKVYHHSNTFSHVSKLY